MSESNNSSHHKAPRFSPTKFRTALRIALIFVVYLLAFAILDSRSHTLQVFPGIVAWYPPDGLSFALLLTLGARFLPGLAIASLISSFFVFRLALPLSELFGWAILISLAYGLAAWFLRRRVRIDIQLRSTRDLLWMIASAAAVSAILAVISVSASTASGVVPQAERVWATFQWWIGEMIGVLVLTPALLLHIMPHVKRFAEGEAFLQKIPIAFTRLSPSVIIQALSIIAAIYLAVDVSWPNDFHPFFLIAIPLIWIAIQHGISGASIGNILVNFGMTGAVQRHHHFNLAELGQLQLMMLVITLASLLIGIIVSENKRLMDTPMTEMRRQRKKVVDELIIVSILGMAAWVLEYTFDFYEAVSEWETRHQIKGLEETLVAISVLSLAAAAFSYRRWKEVQVEIRGREKAQAELQTLYLELETRVQGRTADLSKSNELLQAEITERKQVEESLLKSERRFRALLEHSLEEISLVDPEGTLIFESPTTRRPLGYPPGSFVGHSLFELFHPDDRDSAIKLLEQVSGQPGGYREALFRLRHLDGSWRWMEGVVTNLLDEPAVQAIVINYRDVTERKQAEEEIESLARFPSENPNPVVRIAPDGRILFANRASAPLLEFWGRQVDQTLPDEWQEYLVEAFESGQVKEVEIEHIGQTFSCTLAPTREAGYINLYGRDITERKQAEEALSESDKRFRSLFENSPVSIWEEDFSQVKAYLESLEDVNQTDLETYLIDHPDVTSRCVGLLEILDMNQASMQLHGAKNKTELLENLQKTFTPESFVTFRQELIALWKGERRLEIDGVVQTLAGLRRDVTIIWAVVPGYEKNYSRVLVSLIDITERRQAEEEIRTRTDELLALYALSRALAEADNLEEILELVNRHAVESIHTTFARIALLEGDNFVIRAAYPVRVLDRELLAGNRVPVTALPHCKRAMEQNEPLILSAGDPALSSSERAALLLDFAQSICLVPLRSSGHEAKSKYAMGLLMLGEARSERREPFSPAKVRLAQSIGEQTAIAIRRMLLQGQTERRLQHLTALREIDQAIASSFGLRVSLDTLLTQVINQLSIDAASVWLFNFESNTLEFSAGRGFRTTVFEKAKPLRLGEGYAGRAALEGRTIHISDLVAQQDNPRLMRALAGEEFVSYYGIPLIARESVQGVLEVFHRTTLEPDEDWLGFLNTLAGQAAIAIDNATLFDNLLRSNYQLNQAYDATIEGWSAAMDLRDKETEGHTQRVTEMTIKLAKVTGFSKQELIQVRRGALLHDIGKMGVPDRILLKPDKLTDEEWEVMRMHPTYAYQMLEPITYLGPALEIPYCHHEKWDGTGYPRGLKGEEIPLAARIFAVVDVYDALTSDRPYRKSWSREKTLDYIRELSGSHFDPQVVDAFLMMVGEDH